MSELYSMYNTKGRKVYHIFTGTKTSGGICILKDKLPICGSSAITIDITDYKFKCNDESKTINKITEYLDEEMDICMECIDKLNEKHGKY